MTAQLTTAAKHPGTKAQAPHDKAPKDRQYVTALARGLQILSCFSAERPQLSGSDICKLTGLPQSTVWRLCHTMLTLGMLIPTAGDKMRPGLPVLRLGHSALMGMEVLELARPHMQEIADRFGGACGLSTPDGLNMVFIERCESSNQLVMNLRRGSAVPIATSSSGWAYLAGLPIDARTKMIAELRKKDAERWTLASKHIEKALDEYAKRGYVLNEGVFHAAYNTVATPVFGPHGKVIYSLNSGAATATLPVAVLRKEVAPKLVALARMLESVTGAT